VYQCFFNLRYFQLVKMGLRGDNSIVHLYFLPHTCTVPTVTVPAQVAQCTALTCSHHPRPTVYMRPRSWRWPFGGFISHHSTTQNIIIALKVLHASPLSLPSPKPWSPPVVFLSPELESDTEPFSDWLLSLGHVTRAPFWLSWLHSLLFLISTDFKKHCGKTHRTQNSPS
jgi:hypothetical protein